MSITVYNEMGHGLLFFGEREHMCGVMKKYVALLDTTDAGVSMTGVGWKSKAAAWKDHNVYYLDWHELSKEGGDLGGCCFIDDWQE